MIPFPKDYIFLNGYAILSLKVLHHVRVPATGG